MVQKSTKYDTVVLNLNHKFVRTVEFSTGNCSIKLAKILGNGSEQILHYDMIFKSQSFGTVLSDLNIITKNLHQVTIYDLLRE